MDDKYCHCDEVEEIELEEDILKPSLDTIPKEIFLLVCSHLDAKFVLEVLSVVCCKFNEILSDEFVWKYRFKQHHDCYYSSINDNFHFDYKQACIVQEEHQRLWKNPEKTFNHHRFTTQHFGCVHDIHFLGDGSTCASASYDKSIIIWNVNSLFDESQLPENINKFTLNDAHKGWVWKLTSCDKYLYSTGWDSNLKIWDLHSLQPAPFKTLRFDSPVLACDVNQNLLCCGLWNHKIHLQDIRSLSKIACLNYHKGSILSLITDENYLISSSDDNKIITYDLKASKILNKVHLTETPISMSYNLDLLWVGGFHGNMHLINPTDTKNQLVATYPSGHGHKINDIIHSYGSITTCSSDKTIRVHKPSENPKLISVFPVSHLQEVACIESNAQNILAVGCGNEVHFWVPKELQDNH